MAVFGYRDFGVHFKKISGGKGKGIIRLSGLFGPIL
jgi:hypothetical protein